MPNMLSGQSSPYLLQHADNPVDWRPWGEEAFAEAARLNKPVFLSIGYATCHWCHVMAHESFEDTDIAAILNREFISIKVDREERPDVDAVYMAVCQALTGSGGWPLSLFLTPEKLPFFAGTYFPPRAMPGRPAFRDLIIEIARRWKKDPESLKEAGGKIKKALLPRQTGAPGQDGGEPGLAEAEKAYWMLARSFDPKRGGFGGAPKFPTPHQLTFLLRWHLLHPESKALSMVETTLSAMRKGGIYDQLGFGFHRYSVDDRWLVPHFEKMLYDQALLAIAYVEAFQVTGKKDYADTAREVMTYVLRDMTSPAGGFYSAEDADSEGKEGTFYVWRPEEAAEVLGEDLGGLFNAFYDIRGNFEHGLSIPWINQDETAFAERRGLTVDELRKKLARAGKELLSARNKRERPLLDDKVLTAWNGLMIAALAKAGHALNEPEYIKAAEKAAAHLLNSARGEDGRLLRGLRLDSALGKGFLEDYAFFIWGLIELHQAGLRPEFLEEALDLTDDALRHFWDELRKGFFFTPHDHEELIIRDKDIFDGATPSGNSVMALNLLRLARLTGRADWEKKAGRLLTAFNGKVARGPMAFTQLMQAVLFRQARGREVVLAGPAGDPELLRMHAHLGAGFYPDQVWLGISGADDDSAEKLAPFTRGMAMKDGRPTAYVCENRSCKQPVTGLAGLKGALKE